MHTGDKTWTVDWTVEWTMDQTLLGHPLHTFHCHGFRHVHLYVTIKCKLALPCIYTGPLNYFLLNNECIFGHGFAI